MKSILIIDDESALCQLMKMYLEKSGDYHVDTATSGLSGVKKATEKNYDALVVDVLMPDISGYETVKRIRGLGGSKSQIPVVAISARPSMKEIFHMAEIHAFLGKPFQMEQLKGILDSLCQTDSQPVKKTEAVEEAPAHGPKKVLVAGMEKFMISKIQSYLEQLGFQVIVNYDESDTVSIAAQNRPALILYQFWEEADKFNASHLLTQTQSNPGTQNIPCLVFCAKNVEFEAAKELPKDKLLTYQDSRDLLSKLRSHLPA